MTQQSLFKPAFLISVLAGLIGAFLKIMHLPGTEIFIILSVLLIAVYVISALYEIWDSYRIPVSEKLMWTTGFIFLCAITGFLYFYFGRTRVLKVNKLTGVRSTE